MFGWLFGRKKEDKKKKPEFPDFKSLLEDVPITIFDVPDSGSCQDSSSHDCGSSFDSGDCGGGGGDCGGCGE